ncbi:hypothetical protein AQF52_3946 [Streptomyces venezuelae]|uniref:hypothetical protein n=1 Tax=Streptomyces gardneri TaxID=66892 RepID=UPI0006BC193A|nr:hypothetical protein [Streptomyces gardneri]ALO09540.1 hypothetical protein AQF52_3946 [Streptomyces venezuelae]QPK46633.1 hypothetical protein H4W23_19685 [Streptomyces gardneri]WRK38026.1 hypothetical protein U0M97_19780 [Streptomyces venezuelae]CUM40036.1 hypothetical protein BN2537_9037 [Streptomyces venezuelae]
MTKIKALPDVPRWAALAAHAVPLVTLPSGLWRLALVAGLPVTQDAELGTMSFWESSYVVSLSVVSELLAFLTLGLVRSWGEVFPRWMPFLGGRRVNPAAATAAAFAGVAGLCAIVAWGVYASVADLGPGIPASPAQDALLVACYAPLLAWPVLLAAVAASYYRRRTRAAGSGSGSGSGRQYGAGRPSASSWV